MEQEEQKLKQWFGNTDIQKIITYARNKLGQNIESEEYEQLAYFSLLKTLRSHNPNLPNAISIPFYFRRIFYNELKIEYNKRKRRINLDKLSKINCAKPLTEELPEQLDLDFLEFKEKELIQLRYYEGWTLRELSDNVGITIEGIRRRIKRILEKIRVKYEGVYNQRF